MYIESNEYWMFDNIKSLKEISKKQISKTIELLSLEIDEYCNTKFEPTSDSYVIDLQERFQTRRQPLLEITSLSLRGRKLKENRDYFVYPESSRVEMGQHDCKHYKKALEINYLFGYTEVPATVKQVIAELLKLDVEAKSSTIDCIQSESWDNEYSYTKHASKDLTPTEIRKNILSRLDIFKVEPYVETSNAPIVRARLL